MALMLRTALPFVAAMGVIADAVRHAATPLVSPYRDGVYVGPFTNLTDTFLNVVNLTDGYGPEDKLQACSGTLVFIDLDSDGEWFAYNGTWDRGSVTLNDLCPVGSQLFPRGNGYTVGTALSPVTGLDRLIILGGADAVSKHNVYYSDDCGRSWSCSSAPQVWPMQDYASIVRAPTNYGADITIMGAGGSLTGDTFGNFLFSGDGGISWGRPQCASSSPCQADCEALHRTICTLADFEPDATGNCNNASDWRLCYIMPDWPVYPGALATDWDALWLWMEYGNRVWRLAAGEITTGWNLTTARWGGYGRKVLVNGTAGLLVLLRHLPSHCRSSSRAPSPARAAGSRRTFCSRTRGRRARPTPTRRRRTPLRRRRRRTALGWTGAGGESRRGRRVRRPPWRLRLVWPARGSPAATTGLPVCRASRRTPTCGR